MSRCGPETVRPPSLRLSFAHPWQTYSIASSGTTLRSLSPRRVTLTSGSIAVPGGWSL